LPALHENPSTVISRHTHNHMLAYIEREAAIKRSLGGLLEEVPSFSPVLRGADQRPIALDQRWCSFRERTANIEVSSEESQRKGYNSQQRLRGTKTLYHFCQRHCRVFFKSAKRRKGKTKRSKSQAGKTSKNRYKQTTPLIAARVGNEFALSCAVHLSDVGSCGSRGHASPIRR
jgi:hypothetical protein